MGLRSKNDKKKKLNTFALIRSKKNAMEKMKETT